MALQVRLDIQALDPRTVSLLSRNFFFGKGVFAQRLRRRPIAYRTQLNDKLHEQLSEVDHGNQWTTRQLTVS